MTDEHGVRIHQYPQRGVRSEASLHPAWTAFIKYCKELDHGEIEILKIQNGIPVLAEVTRKKVKFGQ